MLVLPVAVGVPLEDDEATCSALSAQSDGGTVEYGPIEVKIVLAPTVKTKVLQRDLLFIGTGPICETFLRASCGGSGGEGGPMVLANVVGIGSWGLTLAARSTKWSE